MSYCGMVAIVGRPNVGKSTLLNRLVGKKISITSRKPQTTRYQILALKTTQDTQIIYVDTPGLHQQEKAPAMNRYMNRVARAAWQGVDLIIFVIDAQHWNNEDQWILTQLPTPPPVILVLNKTDQLSDPSTLLPYMKKMSQQFNFYKIIPVSAKTGDQVDVLEKEIKQCLPQGPFQFPPDQLTDRGEQFMAAEIIREKLMRQLGQEIPYAVTVTIEAWQKEKNLIRISAIIWTEKSGQKGIIIGKQGERLKKIGKNARLDMEKFFGKKVFLQLWVKMKSGWSDNEATLRELGYEE